MLSARGLSASAGGLIGALLADPRDRSLLADDGRKHSHICIARRAMACEFSVYLPADFQQAVPAGEAALAEIEAMEDLLSVYRGDSALAYVNQHAAAGPVRVDARLFNLLQRTAELGVQTGGAFDVAAGALVRAWGFLRGPRRVPSDAERAAALASTGMGRVELNADDVSVRFTRPGVEINLGAIGKGYAIDRALARMRGEFGVECALIQGGMSSLRAIGSPAGDGRGWLLGLENPVNPAERLATVRLRDRALGTSGTAHQYFETDGRRYGHVLDPRRGEPADQLASVSVLAHDAATADALSTALFVLGLDKAVEFCENHRDIAALIVLKPDGQPRFDGRPRVLTLNISPQDVSVQADFRMPVPPERGAQGTLL